MLSLGDINNFYYENRSFKNDKHGMLITFDDGLSDHFLAAKILAEYHVRGIFFIPTCIFEDNLPANPIIIHYTIAEFGIDKFIQEYRTILEKNELDFGKFNLTYEKGKDDVWKTISNIKSIFKYKLGYKISRQILIQVYKKLFFKRHPDALQIMHLTRSQVKRILDMGHYIGTHTHTHIPIANSELTQEDFFKEVIWPRKYLEEEFNTKVISMSYPFGGKNDCFRAKELINKTNEYCFAFTVEEILNTKKTSPYEIGRYQPKSIDDTTRLNMILNKLVL